MLEPHDEIPDDVTLIPRMEFDEKLRNKFREIIHFFVKQGMEVTPGNLLGPYPPPKVQEILDSLDPEILKQFYSHISVDRIVRQILEEEKQNKELTPSERRLIKTS